MAVDPKATLQAVADAGYAYVETANYDNGLFYGMAPADFKAYLESPWTYRNEWPTWEW